ncbi:MAG: DUF5615 family PIN-like protein [Dermatophilaceae bacterium]
MDSGLAGGVDDDVLESARTDGRVLVSSDTDFGELLARASAALPRLILFRQGDRALGNLEQVAEDLDEVAIVVFTNDNIRIRRLPIQN